MTSEDPLATIPTEQLTLRLLQELAARVDKLEQVKESEKKGKSSESKAGSTDSPTEESPATDGQDVVSRSLGMSSNTFSFCITCNKLFGARKSCNCVLIPYGYMLQDEVPGAVYDYMPPASKHPSIEGLTHIEDRVRALEHDDPGRAERLKKVGFAGIPDDGRLPFKNLWREGNSDGLEKALRAMNNISSVDGHRFWVLDISPTGNGILYGPDHPQIHHHDAHDDGQCYPIYGQKLHGDSEFEAPDLSVGARGKHGLWNRIM